MTSRSGKYELVKNENWLEYMIANGVPEDKAKELNASPGTLSVHQEGNKVTVKSERVDATYVLDQEVDEKLGDHIYKSLAKHEGKVLTVTSKGEQGSFTREYTFTDSGVVLKLKNDKATATRTYKKI